MDLLKGCVMRDLSAVVYKLGLAVLLVLVWATWAYSADIPWDFGKAPMPREVQEPPRGRAPCEVRPPEREAAPERALPRPAAEIEESSDRDPVQPVPKPRKGQPDGRAVVEAGTSAALPAALPAAPPAAPQVAHHPIYDHPRAQEHLRQAATTGSPVVVGGDEDGKRVLWTFRPDGKVDRTWAGAPVGATGPPAPNVIPPQGAPSAPVYYPPAAYYQPMPAGGPAAQRPFPGRGATFVSGSRWESHSCPVCKRQQRWEIDGWVSANEHLHACPDPNCVDANGQHTYWRH